MTTKNQAPDGWQKLGSNPERYRRLLGNGRMLMVVRFSPRKWYYGEAVLGRRKGWTSRGHETNREAAMAAAWAYSQDTFEQR